MRVSCAWSMTWSNRRSEVNPALSGATSLAIQRAIQVDPRKRWQTAAEFKAALHGQTLPEEASGELPGLACSGTPALTWPTRSRLSRSVRLAGFNHAEQPAQVKTALITGRHFYPGYLGRSRHLCRIVSYRPFWLAGERSPTRGALTWALYATRTAWLPRRQPAPPMGGNRHPLCSPAAGRWDAAHRPAGAFERLRPSLWYIHQRRGRPGCERMECPGGCAG